MKNHFEHKAEMRKLAEQMTPENHETIVEKMNLLEREYNQERKLELLRNVNGYQSRRRELASQAWEAEETTEDITTADGSLHKVKARKYPKLAAIQYLSITEVKDGKIIEMRINGERFTMYRAKYEYNQPTTYTRPASFDDFLELNNIAKTDITIQQYEEIDEKLQKLNTDIKVQIEQYKKHVDLLNIYTLQSWGIASQNAEHFYTYSLKN